jgi:hypothetical protein
MTELQERIDAGTMARKWVAELAVEQTHPHFWRTLATMAAARCGMEVVHPIIQDAPMTDAEASAFQQTEMPFGKHRGIKLVDIDAEYLSRLTDPSEFLVHIKRYVAWRNSRFQEHCEGEW